MATTKSTAVLSKRAAIYARQSITRGVVDDSLSLEFQQTEGKAWIARQGYQFAGVFTDADTKGWRRSRPQFDRMLGLMQTGQIDLVIVYKLSRFFRGLVEQEQLITEIANAGGELASITEPWVSASPMVRQILGAVNEDHKRVLGDYLKSTFSARSKRGLHHGSAPYGYRNTDGGLVVDEAAASVIRDIFSLGLAGQGAIAIAATLNGKGVPAPAGGQWAPKVIHRTLRNPCYAGSVQLNGEIVAENAHPALIDPESFSRLQTILESRAQVRMKPDGVSWTDGFVEHACGGRMYLTSWPARTTGTPWRFRCGNRLLRRECGLPGGSAFPEPLEALFVEALGERLSQLLTPDEIITQIERQRSEPARDRERRLARLEKRIAELGKRRGKLLDKMLDGTVDDDLYRKQDSVLKADLEQQMAERDAIPASVDSDDIAVTHAEVARLTEHIGIVAAAAPEELPPLLHAIGARLVIGGERPRIRLSGELESFFASQ